MILLYLRNRLLTKKSHKFHMADSVTDVYQLSVDKVLARACQLLVILFCLIAVVGYLDQPFNMLFSANTGFDWNKLQIIIIPIAGLSLYLLMNKVERHIYRLGKKFSMEKYLAYYNSIAKMSGLVKLLILFTGIIITVQGIHHMQHVDSGVADCDCSVLIAPLTVLPLIFIISEIRNIRKALDA